MSDPGHAPTWRVERLTDPADVDAVVTLEATAFRRPVARDPLVRDLGRPDVARVYVLRTPDRPIAAFCACWLVVDELHINTIAVDPACRGQGMATYLMQQVLAKTAAAGATRATLEVRASNVAARRLYEKLGFVVAAVRRQYYAAPEEDGLILWRTVDYSS